MAIGMTKHGAALRYCAAVVVISATDLVARWFYSSGVYQNSSNLPLRDFPQDVDFFFVLTFAATLIGLKYLIYDLSVRAFTRRYRSPAILVWVYAGYLAALSLDMAAVFFSSTPVADAGFAILAAVFQSPLVLLAAAAVVAAIALRKVKPQEWATRAP
jgi:hypothetical protein